MKKLLALAAICAGVIAFANIDFAEAADQQVTKVTSITQSTTVDMQQLSTKRTEDRD